MKYDRNKLTEYIDKYFEEGKKLLEKNDFNKSLTFFIRIIKIIKYIKKNENKIKRKEYYDELKKKKEEET